MVLAPALASLALFAGGEPVCHGQIREPTKLDGAIRYRENFGFRTDRDYGRSLRLLYFTGGGARFERVELTERRNRVRVGIVERVPSGFRTDDLRFESRVIRLRRPLGGRRVVDAGTRRTVTRLRCRPLRTCFEQLLRPR